MPEYGNSEFRELANIITRYHKMDIDFRDIFIVNPNVRWTDIAGLSRSKRLVRESVVYPLRFPE
jgi:katanin p60 ATPase-containing subunit A1